MSDFEERARARQSWPLRTIRLGDEERTDPREHLTVDERLALVWTLTRQLWAFRGEPIPDYERGQAPGRIIRGR